MAKREYKIPERFRNAVEPVLLKDERIIFAFRESFSFFGDSVLPKWTVLTNLKLIFLVHEIPGIGVFEFYLQGMTIELFEDSIGFYNRITFLLNGKEIYELHIIKNRWPEAEVFVHEVQQAISQIEYELRSESDNSGSDEDSQVSSAEKKQCNYEKRHLKDLADLRVITDEEYKEELEKPCKR